MMEVDNDNDVSLIWRTIDCCMSGQFDATRKVLKFFFRCCLTLQLLEDGRDGSRWWSGGGGEGGETGMEKAGMEER